MERQNLKNLEKQQTQAVPKKTPTISIEIKNKTPKLTSDANELKNKAAKLQLDNDNLNVKLKQKQSNFHQLIKESEEMKVQ